jgi:hypothetical protein
MGATFTTNMPAEAIQILKKAFKIDDFEGLVWYFLFFSSALFIKNIRLRKSA